MFKKILITCAIILTITLSIGVIAAHWLSGFTLTTEDITQLKNSKKSDIPYLKNATTLKRGKILAVVSSHQIEDNSTKKTGYELTELSRAYWVFHVNGFDVDIASPKGGTPQKVLDEDDMGAFDYAFLNDPIIKEKINNTLKIEELNHADYDAVYFVGGKGAMFDFPDNKLIQKLVQTMYENNKVISAVCHGPAALVNVKLSNGDWLIANSQVSSFTNEEELFLIPDAAEFLPFLLQDELIKRGAKFNSGYNYLNQVSHDNKLITGQNPWSVWELSEQIISSLGYTPVKRELTPEENSINLLITYEKSGYEKTNEIIMKSNLEYQKMLIVMHGFIAVLKMNITKAVDLLFLVSNM